MWKPLPNTSPLGHRKLKASLRRVVSTPRNTRSNVGRGLIVIRLHDKYFHNVQVNFPCQLSVFHSQMIHSQSIGPGLYDCGLWSI